MGIKGIMKKHLMGIVLIFSLALVLSGCSRSSESMESNNPDYVDENTRVPYISQEPGEKERAFVMMDSGSDSAFMAYKGSNNAAGEFGYDLIVEYYYDLNDGTILDDIQKHASAGRRFILFPGPEFRDAVLQSHSIFSDVSFVILDSDVEFGENIKVLDFSEYDMGYLAGYTAAIELKDARFGFIGGFDDKLNNGYLSGFIDGLESANEKEGTLAEISEDNILFNNSYFNLENAATLASGMYDRGVDAIFIATGKAGKGAVAEAALRTFSGDTRWIIGADGDWYDEGIYNGIDSVVLTSVIKRYDTAAYLMSESYINGDLDDSSYFEGTLANNCIGLPDVNPNISKESVLILVEEYPGIYK